MKILRSLWVLVLALVAGFAVQAQRLSGSMTITNLTVTTINGYNADAVLTNSAAGKLDITNGTAVNLTGSLTNVSIKGALTYELSDESRLSANHDYGIALDVGLSSTVAKARIRSVSTIADLVSVDPLTSDIFSYVKVLGYAAAGDGGGGDFRRVLASSGTTNTGTFFASTANPTYAWERVSDSNEVNVRWFGATGDGSTDDTAAIQAAIDYAPAGSTITFPRGQFRFANVTIEKPLTIDGNAPNTRLWTDTISGGSLTNNTAGTELIANANGWLFIVEPDGTNYVDIEQCLLPVTFYNVAFKGDRRAYFADGTTGAGGVYLNHCFAPSFINCSFDSFRRSSIYLHSSVREARFISLQSRFCGDRAAATPYPDWWVYDNATNTSPTDPGNDRHNMVSFIGCQSVFPFGDALKIGTAQPTTAGRVVSGLKFSDCWFHGFVSSTDGGAFNGVLEMTNATRQAFVLTTLESANDITFTGCSWNYGGVAAPMMEFKQTAGHTTPGYDTARNVRVVNASFKATFGGVHTGTSAIKNYYGSGSFTDIQVNDKAKQFDQSSSFDLTSTISSPQFIQYDAVVPFIWARRGTPSSYYDTKWYLSGGWSTYYSSGSLSGLFSWSNSEGNADKNVTLGVQNYTFANTPIAMVSGEATAASGKVALGASLNQRGFTVTSGELYAHGSANATNATKIASWSTAGLSVDSGTLATAGAIELGHASDTTLARSAAGVVSVEGNPLIGANFSQELQDTVDYGVALTPNGVTPTSNDASPRPRSVATIAALVADVDPLLVPTYARVSVLGYSAAGDGGGGDFRRVLTSSGTTNAGTFFASTANPTYAWQRVIGDGQITSAQWGVTTGSDDLAAMQSWVDYAAANNLLAVLADGSYLLTNSLVIPSNLRLSGSYNSVFERAAVSSQTNSHNFAALRTAYTFNPYQTNGGISGPTVPGYVTNVVLSGFRLKTAENHHSSFGIAAFCVDNWQLDSLTVEVMTNHWAITYFGNNIRTRNCLINNGGGIYQDGIHVLGGDSLIFAGNIVSSGDDAFALSPGGMQQQDISNVSIVGNVANSTHAHGIRMFIENESGTNYVRNIVVDGLTGYVAQDRNALVRLESASTNVTYGITNVSLSNIRLIGGDMAAHGGGIAGSDYGYVIHNADNVIITDNHIGPTTLWNLYLLDCGTITLTDCTAEGSQYSSLNATMYVENVENLTINGGRYRNGSGVTTDTIWIKKAGNVKMTGVTVENTITNRAAVTLFGTAASSFSAVNNTFTNSAGYSITSYTNPDRVLLTGNILNSIQGISWQGGSPPSGSVVINNVGVTESTIRTGTEYTIESSGGSYLGGIGSRSSLVRFASTNGTFVFATDDTTGGTKSTRVATQSSSSGTPIAAFSTVDTGSIGSLTVGGSSVLMKSPATVDIATDVNYGSGTSRVRVSTNGVVIEPAGVSSSADASAALEVRSTTLGILLPRTTATPTSAADGLLWYRSDTDVLALRANGATVDVAVRPATAALTYSGTNVTLTATSQVLHGNTLTLTNNCLLTITSSDGASGGITIVPDSSTSYTVYLASGIKLLGGGSSFVVTNSASETVNLEWKQTLRGGSSVILANKAVYP